MNGDQPFPVPSAVPQKENIWCQGSGVVNTAGIQMNTKVNTTGLRRIKALNICAHCEMATRIILTTMHEDKEEYLDMKRTGYYRIFRPEHTCLLTVTKTLKCRYGQDESESCIFHQRSD